jgi:hypothetical protein
LTTLGVLAASVWLLATGRSAPTEGGAEESRELEAERFLTEVMAVWSGDDAEALKWCEDRYTELVDYYGKKVPFRTVYQDKAHFLKRWPVRRYAVRPGSVQVLCGPDTCTVRGIVDWECESPGRGARASGVATARYELIMRAGASPFIAGEQSEAVVQR